MVSIENFRMFNGSFGLFLTIFGVIANTIIVLVVCIRKNLHIVPTFTFTAYIAVIDIIPLLNRNLNNFLILCLGIRLESRSEVYCKANLFLHYFSLQVSAWILVALSIERYLSIVVKTWRVKLFNSKKALLLCVGITLVFLLGNFILNFQSTFEKITVNPMNATFEEFQCVYSSIAASWTEVNTYVYSIIPFIILAIVNCLLIYVSVYKKSSIQRSSQERSRKRTLTVYVIATTLNYFIWTGPVAILGGYFIPYLAPFSYGTAVMSFFSTLRFLYHTSNLFVLISFNKKFSKELKCLIKSFANNRVASNTV